MYLLHYDKDTLIIRIPPLGGNNGRGRPCRHIFLSLPFSDCWEVAWKCTQYVYCSISIGLFWNYAGSDTEIVLIVFWHVSEVHR